MLNQVAEGLYVSAGLQGIGIAGFDLDWTLIRPVHGRFYKDENDWNFLPNRLDYLKELVDKGYVLAIFTNQGYSGKKLVQAVNLINNVIIKMNREGLYPWVFTATGKDSPYRKPNTLMWQVLMNSLPTIDIKYSFYCGDSSGREGDHSADDLNFANNVGLTFYVPEKMFPQNQVVIPENQAMYIFMGMPGSGKSTWYEKHLKPLGWIHANQDILKTKAKVIKTVKDSLVQGKSVAIDGTNPTIEGRKIFIDLAKQYNVPVTILYFVNNGYGFNRLRQNPVPDIAYNIYFKNLVEPSPQIDGVPVIQIES